MRAMESLILFSLLLKAVLSGREWSGSEWRQMDSDEHGYRSCAAVVVEDEENCPKSGFACDAQKSLSTPVLTVDSCNCQWIRCADRGWRLAVNGTIVDKITCHDKHWLTPQGHAVSSVVCARKACQACRENLITISPKSADYAWNVMLIDGACTQLSATCTGPAAEAKVNGQSIAPVTKVVATCDPAGMAWTYNGQQVKTLDCGKKGCQRCADADSPAKVVFNEPANGKVTYTLDYSSGCLVQHNECKGPGPVIATFDDGRMIQAVGTVPFDLDCDAAGTGWLYMGAPVSMVKCDG